MMKRSYNIHLAKGQGMVSETIQLLQVWQPGMSASDLRTKVVQEGLLPKATAARISDIVVRVFAPRFLRGDADTALRLKHLVEHGMSREKLTQLFFVYTAREHSILHDFVQEVYWKHYNAGARVIRKQDAAEFLGKAQAMGRMAKPWSESLMAKAPRYLLSALTDFKLTRDLAKGDREILPFTLFPATTIYLAHDIHFQGASDNSILEHPDWLLFGLDREGVIQELRRAADGHFIIQYSGELLRISWQHQSMEECLDGLTE